MRENIILKKTMDFAIRIVDLYKYLTGEKKEYIMSKQLLKCGTSIGANVYEAVKGQSRNDFLSKIYISFKETSETEYWLKLLTSTAYLNEAQSASILNDCREISRILSSIIKTTKEHS